MPKNEKRHQLSSPLTIDKEQQLSEHEDTKQLVLMHENQKLNSPNIRSPDQYRSQKRYDHHQNAEKKLLISQLEAENR